MNLERKEIFVTTPGNGQLYSDAVVAGGLMYTTGQMPLDEDWNLISESFEEQASYVFAQLEKVLEAGGSGVDQIIRLTIYLADIDDTSRLAPLRRAFLGDARPASVIVQVGAFGTPGMRLEVEAIAAVK
ncbi:RidA family protein [Leucobacter denitrificans]|uniref:RidA family protein n=1 Tax=Leucobacter denitrificans TaxID=683042 RepID=A0A7G9S2B3_9MICO|nr:RidA family protein [Leucobacter denitrificans]QNN61988.1 RidA family protein [Leucobacter denitrificans]